MSSSSSSAGAGSMEVDHQQLLDYGGGGCGGGNNNNPRRCAACKYLRRRCAPDCVLAPYFPASQPRRYAYSLPVQERGRAADTMATEARWRMQDPVYGCTGVIYRLQQEIRAVQHELARTRAQLAVHVQGTALLQRTQQPTPLLPPPQPLAPAAAVAVHAGAHGVTVHEEEDEEAPLMDPDEFLDLDGRF
ncbi:LOB domain-containing protein 24 [Dichanthelium oligosanthes]|uniref:LOB domain-containing protein 24 n=1 Tax=Dichanthelium oligosanthes TaxID=888268 RepID=A0A1E5VMB8_9POAL|nr:LOB domain-containing protein 24 [Dichanthelium oligosanthes]